MTSSKEITDQIWDRSTFKRALQTNSKQMHCVWIHPKHHPPQIGHLLIQWLKGSLWGVFQSSPLRDQPQQWINESLDLLYYSLITLFSINLDVCFQEVLMNCMNYDTIYIIYIYIIYVYTYNLFTPGRYIILTTFNVHHEACHLIVDVCNDDDNSIAEGVETRDWSRRFRRSAASASRLLSMVSSSAYRVTWCFFLGYLYAFVVH